MGPSPTLVRRVGRHSFAAITCVFMPSSTRELSHWNANCVIGDSTTVPTFVNTCVRIQVRNRLCALIARIVAASCRTWGSIWRPTPKRRPFSVTLVVRRYDLLFHWINRKSYMLSISTFRKDIFVKDRLGCSSAVAYGRAPFCLWILRQTLSRPHFDETSQAHSYRGQAIFVHPLWQDIYPSGQHEATHADSLVRCERQALPMPYLRCWTGLQSRCPQSRSSWPRPKKDDKISRSGYFRFYCSQPDAGRKWKRFVYSSSNSRRGDSRL